jgi:hypothetical protein
MGVLAGQGWVRPSLISKACDKYRALLAKTINSNLALLGALRFPDFRLAERLLDISGDVDAGLPDVATLSQSGVFCHVFHALCRSSLS